jgi:hypothetical protein
MIENFGSVFYLIIFIINLAGLGYYTYLTYLNPKQIINARNTIGIGRLKDKLADDRFI